MSKITFEEKQSKCIHRHTLTHRNKSKKIDEPYLIRLLLFIYTYAQSRLTFNQEKLKREEIKNCGDPLFDLKCVNRSLRRNFNGE